MNKNTIRVLVLCLISTVWPGSEKTTPGNSEALTETRVSESRKAGKYKRITETFTDRVLVSRKEEVSLNDDGRIDYVFVKLFRNGAMIYASTFYKTQNRLIRSYYHQGKMVVEEGDEDGDGFFETLILFDAAEQPIEAFSRKKDGTTTQFSQERLIELKESFGRTRTQFGVEE